MLDGFDKYGPTNPTSPSLSTLMTQEWGAFGSNQITTSLNSAGGYAFLNPANASGVNKTFGSTYGRWIGGIRVQPSTGGQPSPIFTINNTNNSLCCLFVIPTGYLWFMTGAQSSGTNIAKSTANIKAGSTHYVEWDITFGASSAYNIYLDGVSIMSGTGNTGNGQTLANRIFLGLDGTANSVQVILDDFYLFDTTGSFNNAVLLTNPRIETRYPSGDSQTQWTNGGNVLVAFGITQTSVTSLTGSVNAPGANELVLLPVKPSVSCSLQSVAISPGTTSAGANFKAVLYSDSTGSPGSLVATGTQVTGVTSGTTLTLPFAVAQSLTGGTQYWIGFINDTSINIGLYDATTNLGQKKANTYGSGAPAGPLSGMTTAQSTWLIWGVCTGATTNWESVAQNPAAGTRTSDGAGDSSSITSSTVNNEDLYSFPNLNATATTVYSVAVKVNAKRSDAGARTIDCRLVSSGNDSGGSSTGQTPGTSYGWVDSYFDTDPNGGGAWTSAGLNAATAGPKVAS